MVRRWIMVGLATILAVGCSATAQPQPTGGTEQSPPVETRAAPKRLLATIRGTPAALSQTRTLRTVGNVPGLDGIEELANAGLTHVDDHGVRIPQLAEDVPTVENGLWRVLSDGRMETTWKIKPAARWQDGVAVTADDFLFAAQVETDKEIGIARQVAFDLIDSMEAPDPSTVLVRWKQPYIEADTLFTYQIALPIPKHILGSVFDDDRTNLLSAPYWTQSFVGAGPYRIREWVLDSHMILDAYDGYVLGRPKIDEIEIHFIPDPNATVANLLTGGVDLTLGRSLLTVDQAQLVQEQWKEARLATSYISWAIVHTQFINPAVPITTDVRFRKALIQAINRQEMVETFMGGQSSITHTFVDPTSAEYKEIEPSIVKYDYDPRRASQMIEGLGYTKGADGIFVDANGQRLQVPMQTTIRSEINAKMLLSVAEYWKQIGVDNLPTFVPVQQIGDRELRATFPGFEVLGAGDIGVTSDNVRRYHSSSTPLPENRFQVTGNNPRYRNAELDSYIDRYVITIPHAERMQLLGQIVHHLSDQLPSMGLFYVVDSTIFANRLSHITPRTGLATQAWNAQEWDITR